MHLTKSASTPHSMTFVRTNSKHSKPRKLKAKERLRGAVETVEFQQANYVKHQRMAKSHYSGRLASDDDDGNVSFHLNHSGGSEMHLLDRLPQINVSSTTDIRPEDTNFSYANMPTSQKMSILQQRHELADMREKAKRMGYRAMTIKMKSLREKERRYYEDSRDNSKKKKKKKKLKSIINKVRGKTGESFAQIAIDSMLYEVNNGPGIDDDESSLGEASYGDESIGGSSLSPSLGGESLGSQVSNVSIMPLEMRMSTNVTIARAMERFNKRKEVFERKKQKTENARAVLLSKVHEKKMKPIRLRKERQRKNAIGKMIAAIVFLNSAKRLKKNFEERKALLAKISEENDAAIKLQRTLSNARKKKMWEKYMQFHAQVFRSKWIFQIAIRTWRKKKSAGVIKTFLLEHKDQNPMNLMVNKFITKVKKVQRFVRHFLSCQKQRLDMLGEIWDEVEDKFSKRLENRMKEARKMKPLKVPKHTKLDSRAVKAYNNTCELWMIMDRKMETLLQSERQKKHLANNRMAAMHLRKLTKLQKLEALRAVLKEQRRWHIKNIADMKDRLLEERKKRALSRYDIGDANQVLNLSSMTGKVERPEEDAEIVESDIPLFLFWTSWGTKAELTKYIEQIYQTKYADLHGDPIVRWKKKMAEEAHKREKNAKNKDVMSKKGAKRRYGVAVSSFVPAQLDIGITTEGLGEDESSFMSKERNAQVVVSTIRSKQRAKEVEDLKARSVVQIERGKRHREVGLLS